jgi:hypothetical protein
VAFLYKSFLQSFFVLEVKVKLFIGAKKMAQLRSKNVGEIETQAFAKSKSKLSRENCISDNKKRLFSIL